MTTKRPFYPADSNHGQQQRFGVKFDYKLNAKNSLAVRYIFGDSLQSGPPFAGLPAGGSNSQGLLTRLLPHERKWRE